ncbi:serine/threonine dehydratase [Lentzea flava]|uniref:Serine/threonine dehydratase n=1 Tax=Lentzea flava TaxID=103732 RepID=A0ABQ2VCR2_9PSEU|nr:serine/threonine dehydratase [Lentzea flava]MCP2204635.1 L-threonine ammonia-lyase (EC 4.3.1.19) [Lentzea flava]GGU80313.1 serine/threonine dehydratase [Lentzea flava]
MRTLSQYVRRTPAMHVSVDGRPLVFKLEHLQLTGSFKIRGAVNTLLSLQASEIVTASGGNHGIAVAQAAQLLGAHATVFVPVTAPESKTARIEALGAKLIRHGNTYAEAAEAAREFGLTYIEAYNDLTVIEGQSTVTREIVEDVPEVDTIAVAVGGGGLIAGAALASGGRRVIAVEPENCCAMHNALAAGEPVDSSVNSVAADALGATRAGSLSLEILQRHGVSSVLVSDEEILAARDRLWGEFRLAVEPAGAVAFAASLRGEVPGALPCVILCGANSEWIPR